MLFQKFVEQHRVHRIVPHGVDLAVVVAHYQIGVHGSHVFCQQAKLQRICSVVLVMELNGLERSGSLRWRFSIGLMSRLDLREELACAELAGGVY